MWSKAIHGLGEGERTKRVEGAWGWGERRGEMACEQGGGKRCVTDTGWDKHAWQQGVAKARKKKGRGGCRVWGKGVGAQPAKGPGQPEQHCKFKSNAANKSWLPILLCKVHHVHENRDRPS